jgi:hypothetical protein
MVPKYMSVTFSEYVREIFHKLIYLSLIVMSTYEYAFILTRPASNIYPYFYSRPIRFHPTYHNQHIIN